MVELCREHEVISNLNNHSFDDERVTVISDDAFIWLRDNREQWDIIILDMPDPDTPETAKLYSLEFYRMVRSRLTENGAMSVQSTSSYHARRAFLTIGATLREAGLAPVPYHVNVPSFGEWGFHVAMRGQTANEGWIKSNLENFQPTVQVRYLNQDALNSALLWGIGDLRENNIIPSRLARPTIQIAYNQAWHSED